MSVINQNQSNALKPFTNNTGNTVTKLKLEVPDMKHGKMCANESDRFGFTSDIWMKNWRKFLSQSQSIAGAKSITFQHSNEICSNQCCPLIGQLAVADGVI